MKLVYVFLFWLIISCGKTSTKNESQSKETSNCLKIETSELENLDIQSIAKFSYKICKKCNISPLKYVNHLQDKGLINE